MTKRLPKLRDTCSITDGKCDLVDFSDHALVSCSLKRNGVSNSLESTSVFTTRHWSNHGQGTDVVRMEEALARHMAALTLSSIGINSMWNEWKTKFIAALDDVAPRICITKKNKRRRCPWMTPELLRVLHEQKSLFKKIKKSRKPCVECSGGSRIWVTGGGGGRGILRPQNLWSLRDHGEGLPSPPLGGPGACSPGKFWKLGCADMHFSLFWGTISEKSESEFAR